VAYACRDTGETRRFYEELMGFSLRHTEVAGFNGIMVEFCRDTPGMPTDRAAAVELLDWRPPAPVAG